MMSEKRFYRASVCGDDGLYDKEDGCIIVNVRSNIDLDDNWNTVVDKLNEQQATIRRLQDLCGKSDGENAKLRIENKRLQEENEQLKNKLNKTL